MFALSLHAFQVSMNVWQHDSFADGQIITTLTGNWKVANASLAFDPVQGPVVAPVFNEQRQGLTLSSGNTTTFDGGIYGHGTVCTGSGFGDGPTATYPLTTSWNTSSTIDTPRDCQSELMFVVGRQITFQSMHSFFDNGGAIISQTNSRVFIGLTDQTGATMTNGNDPAGNYVGVRVDSGTDANYRCVIKDGTTQGIADSGVAVTGETGHRVTVREDTAGATWYVWIDDVQRCSFTSNRPASGTVLRFVHGIRNKAAEQKALRLAWIYTMMEK